MQDAGLRNVAARRLLWAAVWLALLLIAIKAYHLGVPHVRVAVDLEAYLRSLAAISYEDVLFATVIWIVARAALVPLGSRPHAARAVSIVFVVVAAISCAYALASVIVFGVFGGFVTYPLLALVGDVRMLSSSAAEYFTPRVLAGLIGVPVAYVEVSGRIRELYKQVEILVPRSPAVPVRSFMRRRGGVGALLFSVVERLVKLRLGPFLLPFGFDSFVVVIFHVLTQ